jgi:DNA-binding NarL/FixJ family response regulator
MPGQTGLQAAGELKRRRPGLRTLMLSMYDSEQYFFEALKAGASGYVLKSAADRDLVEACRAAMRGEPVPLPRRRRGASSATTSTAPPAARRRRPIHSPRARSRSSSSSPRATRATRSPGCSSSPKKTVEHHRSHILEKLGMRDRVELTRYAIRRGLVEP